MLVQKGLARNLWVVILVTLCFYDENYVIRRGDLRYTRVSGGGQVDFIWLSCNRRMYAASIDGRQYGSEKPISPGSAVNTVRNYLCQ